MNGQEQPRYTLILHQIRKQLGLSLMEYCVADSIYHLSNNPTSKVPGWCFASKEKIADFLSTTDRTVFACISSLLEKGLVEKEETTKHLRTTRKWYENVVLIKAKGEYEDISGGMKKLHSDPEESSVKPMKKLQSYKYIDKRNYTNYENKENSKPFKDNLKTLEDRYPEFAAKGAKKP
jgi:hypothetical protein